MTVSCLLITMNKKTREYLFKREHKEQKKNRVFFFHQTINCEKSTDQNKNMSIDSILKY